jgi:hypothetical protein
MQISSSLQGRGACAAGTCRRCHRSAHARLSPQRPVGVETLLATASSASDTVASSVSRATPVATPITEADNAERGGTATRLGVLLIALGLISLLSSSATLRGHRPGRAISRSGDQSAANRGTFSVLDEADQGPTIFMSEGGILSGRCMPLRPAIVAQGYAAAPVSAVFRCHIHHLGFVLEQQADWLRPEACGAIPSVLK